MCACMLCHLMFETENVTVRRKCFADSYYI